MPASVLGFLDILCYRKIWEFGVLCITGRSSGWATGHTCKGSGVQLPDRPARSEMNFSGFHVQHGWFTGIELVLNPKAWVHFLPEPLDSNV